MALTLVRLQSQKLNFPVPLLLLYYDVEVDKSVFATVKMKKTLTPPLTPTGLCCVGLAELMGVPPIVFPHGLTSF